MQVRKPFRAATLGVAVALTLGACASGPDPDQKLESMSGPTKELYDAALEEEPLKWYTSQDPFNMNRTIEAFKKEYPGVEVESLRLTSAPLAIRYSQERDAKARTGDLVTTSNAQFFKDGTAKGWWETFDQSALPATAALDKQWFNNGIATTTIYQFGIGYNTNLVKNPPKTWEEVLDPKYKGKVVFPDYRNSEIYSSYGQFWADDYGKDFLTDLKALNPTIVDSMVPGIQLVASGEAEIALPASLSTMTELLGQGAPLAVSFPDKGVGIKVDTAISKDPVSPNAAKLFYDFLHGKVGQEAFVGETASSPINSKGSLPIPTDGFVWPDYDRLPATKAEMQAIFQLR